MKTTPSTFRVPVLQRRTETPRVDVRATCVHATRQANAAKAALSSAEAERLADAPVLLRAGTLNASWPPTRDDALDPYHDARYNELVGGVALALQWDFGAPMASARTDGARAISGRFVAVQRFADSGIPLRMSKARQEVARPRDVAALAGEGGTATRRRMLFLPAADETGTGEARELPEGPVAHLQPKGKDQR